MESTRLGGGVIRGVISRQFDEQVRAEERRRLKRCVWEPSGPQNAM